MHSSWYYPPKGGEIVHTNKDGKFELTTAQAHNNYLLVRVIAEPKVFGGDRSLVPNPMPEDWRYSPEYEPMVVGPIEVQDDELFLPIEFNRSEQLLTHPH